MAGNDLMNELGNASIAATFELGVSVAKIGKVLGLIDQILAQPSDPGELATWRRIRLNWSNLDRDIRSAMNSLE